MIDEALSEDGDNIRAVRPCTLARTGCFLAHAAQAAALVKLFRSSGI